MKPQACPEQVVNSTRGGKGLNPISENIQISPAAIADKLADDRPYVELYLIVCRECDFSTGVPSSEEESTYAAHNAHYDQTRHSRF